MLALPIRVVSRRDVAAEVLATALETGLSAYDASYLVVAAQADAVLVTADRRLAAAARRSALLPEAGPEGVLGAGARGA